MRLDLLDCFTNQPPELDFIWPHFLSGVVGSIAAPGSTGKSFFALEAAMSVACDVPGGDLLGLNPKKHGRVVYFSAEDPAQVIALRAHAIGKHLNPEARRSISKNLEIEVVVGKRMDLANESCVKDVVSRCDGARLIIFDTLSRVHTLDENSNSEMAGLVNNLDHIAVETGASVLFPHHVNKSSVREGETHLQSALRGASVLSDNPRYGSALVRMSPEEARKYSDKNNKTPIGDRRSQFVRFGTSKQNYDEDMDFKWYRRHEGGVLLPVELKKIKSGTDNHAEKAASMRDEL